MAAHSTVRAINAKYDGPLYMYNVTKPDGTSKQIGLLSSGGFADKKAHDTFYVNSKAKSNLGWVYFETVLVILGQF